MKHEALIWADFCPHFEVELVATTVVAGVRPHKGW